MPRETALFVRETGRSRRKSVVEFVQALRNCTIVGTDVPADDFYDDE